jgi:hypothetical protein
LRQKAQQGQKELQREKQQMEQQLLEKYRDRTADQLKVLDLCLNKLQTLGMT